MDIGCGWSVVGGVGFGECAIQEGSVGIVGAMSVDGKGLDRLP